MNPRPPLLDKHDARCLIRLVMRFWYALNRQARYESKDARVKPVLTLVNEEDAPRLVRVINRAWAKFDISGLSDEEILMLHRACERTAKAFVEERGDLHLDDDATSAKAEALATENDDIDIDDESN